jgi:hypothetical protein
MLKYFKKAAKFKGKVKRPEAKGEKVDRSIYRIGLFGHTSVGKTVFLTVAYAFSKDAPDFQLLAMGDTQAYLEENFNLLKGRGDQAAADKTQARKFPNSTYPERKLSFSAQLGKTVNIPLEILDYWGKNLYIDSPMGIQQNVMDFFQLCDCVLFFIDPEAINNEGELAKRTSSFTHVIKQLSGRQRKLNIPVGLVIAKADELPGFKSGLQSTLISGGAGYIKGMRFNDFLNKVIKQPYLADYPEWKNTIRAVLSRLQSFFIPLIKSTLDYQVFFVSSTGVVPQEVSDKSGAKVKVPPADFRPLGVIQPIEWALRRIRACRLAVVFNVVLKWFVFAALLVLILVSSLNIYNKMKIDSLINKVANVKLDRLEAYSGLASAFNSYTNDIMVKLFFGDFRQVTNAKYDHFAGISGDDRLKAQFKQFNLVKDSVGVLLSVTGEPGTDTITYKSTLSSLNNLIAIAEDLERSIKTQGYSTTWMVNDLKSWKDMAANMPSVKDHQTVAKLINEYMELKKDLADNLAGHNYVYLLDLAGDSQFPGKLTRFKGKLEEYVQTPGVEKYAEKIENYLELATELGKKGDYIFFTVSGADPGSNGYSVTFSRQPGFPEGMLDISSRERIRIPASNDIEIKLHHISKVMAVDNCVIPSGFEILSWHNKKLCFKEGGADVRLRFDLDEFDSALKNAL